MEPEEADDVRLLLSFGADTAGGLMTPEPIILSAESTVAEGLAMIRRNETAPALAAAVCITLPPYEAPTGRFLGMVHFQRMLRYPPHERLGSLIDPGLEPISVDTPAAEVSRILASYNLVSVPVIDETHRLVGVVTVDDVLDYLLPDDWRSHDDEDTPASAAMSKRTPKKRPATKSAAGAAKTTTRGRSALNPRPTRSRDRFGRFTETIARGMGTPWFLLGLTIFAIVWMTFNTFAPEAWRFDSYAIGFTALTLILSLQASYAAPMILLAQNRQDDRDRVQFEQDRQRAERNLADTEYLAALRLAMKDMATKDFIKSELRALLEELEKDDAPTAPVAPSNAKKPAARSTTRSAK
jgi:uncharacterized membrane protein